MQWLILSVLPTALLLDRSFARPQLAERASGGCCFHLSASGGPGGDVGQLSDGQNRIGQANLPTPKARYCLGDDGGECLASESCS